MRRGLLAKTNVRKEQENRRKSGGGDKDSYERPGRGQMASYIYCFAEATGTGRWVAGLAPSKVEGEKDVPSCR